MRLLRLFPLLFLPCFCSCTHNEGAQAKETSIFFEEPLPELPPEIAAYEKVVALYQYKEETLTAWLAGGLEWGEYRATMDSLTKLVDELAVHLAPGDSLLLERLDRQIIED